MLRLRHPPTRYLDSDDDTGSDGIARIASATMVERIATPPRATRPTSAFTAPAKGSTLTPNSARLPGRCDATSGRWAGAKDCWPTLDGRADELDSDDQEELGAVLSARRALRRRQRDTSPRVNKPHRRYRGSVAGRRPNKDRQFDVGLDNILRDYFGINGRPPVYDETDFERRFRVPRAVFLRVYEAIKSQPSFRQTINATGRRQAHPLQKVVAAFRVMAYGESYDRADEYVRLSRSTVSHCTKKLSEFIEGHFSPAYLRKPTYGEVASILARNQERGLPGCIGSLDCMHWKWDACPAGKHGLYHSHKKARSIIIEAACDEDLWIWHWFVGSPGSYNDVNVLNESPLFDAVQAGTWPPRGFTYVTNGHERSAPYYLVDGIYPRHSFLVSPYETPATPQERAFNRLQEAMRKDVERLFGVLTRRFHIAMHPARYRSVEQLNTTARAVAILHNMTVEHRREGFIGRQRLLQRSRGALLSPAVAGGTAGPVADAERDAEDEGAHPLDLEPIPHHPAPSVAERVTVPPDGTFLSRLLRWAEVTDSNAHLELRNDLAADVWSRRREYLRPYVV